MSIVIKGAQMPENCKECLYVYDGFACTITGEYIHWDIAEKTRMHDCPLEDAEVYLENELYAIQEMGRLQKHLDAMTVGEQIFWYRENRELADKLLEMLERKYESGQD